MNNELGKCQSGEALVGSGRLSQSSSRGHIPKHPRKEERANKDGISTKLSNRGGVSQCGCCLLSLRENDGMWLEIQGESRWRDP